MRNFIKLHVLLCCIAVFFTQMHGNSIIFEITEKNFKQNVEQSSLPVFMMLTASWCPRCFQLTSLMTELLHDFENYAIFATIDVDKENDFVHFLLNDIFQKHYQIIGGFPVILVFYKGIFIKSFFGFYKDRQDLKNFLDKILCELAK